MCANLDSCARLLACEFLRKRAELQHEPARGEEVRDSYLTQLFFKVILHKSTPPQIRQLILYYH